MHYPLVSWPVDDDRGVRMPAFALEVVLRAPQIAERLLANRGQADNRALGSQLSAAHHVGDREQCRQPARIVADPASDQACPVLPDGDVILDREDGVEVRAQDDRRRVEQAGALRDDIADPVHFDMHSRTAETFAHVPGAIAFHPGRRGDPGQRDLLADDLRVARVESHASVAKQSVRALDAVRCARGECHSAVISPRQAFGARVNA